jgi:phosphoribosylaminoimidazolecarboxamide formyltransferase/IMP cyclohydrolase
MTRIEIRRALVSVYDKTGLDVLARGLHEAGVEIVSTGGSAAYITDLGIPVTPLAEVTGFPEILDGRVKTLHPRIHAGLLADTRNPDHLETLDEHGIAAFQLVVSNLYPFRETVAAGASDDETVEQIDIGGPSMVRASAKNHASVAVVTSPSSYPLVQAALTEGGFDLAGRRSLAAQAFAHTASYDVAVARWCATALAPGETGDWPAFAGVALERAEVLRYGENPQQAACLYVDRDAPEGLAQAVQLHGKAMSYNNYVDTDAARRAAYDFAEPCVAVIKHANPCGIAVGVDVADAHRKAHACDSMSAFGGVIAVNRTVSVAMAEQVAEIFTEVIVAPGYDDGAVEVLSKKPSIRVLTCPPLVSSGPAIELKQLSGGMLAQEVDRIDAAGDDPVNWSLQAGGAASPAMLADLAFAWRAVRAVKSNAILLAHDGATVGVGMGQVNRVDAAHLAVQRAGDRARGSVGASDAFFPFADGFEALAAAGVAAVVEPGGSTRDQLTIDAAAAAGVTLYFTGTRHFFHG